MKVHAPSPARDPGHFLTGMADAFVIPAMDCNA